MKSIFGESAVIASALLVGSLILSATPSAAETPSHKFQEPRIQNQDPINDGAAAKETLVPASETPSPTTTEAKDESLTPAPAPVNYVATAYSLRGRTASGKMVAKGIIAADPRVLPLGSRVLLHAGGYSGESLVADTGGAIRGRRIDIWIPSSREALRFGRRLVKLTVLSYGAKKFRNRRSRTLVAAQ